ncbi:aminotransferase class V-fold PLP-dependent enzyme [Bdellovibrio sp. HCB209]|uniref:aminotransferase class V-fold PLP-dependent enzyme n=1 Tax=Bdellovibrio sp. HCB209 TaxID=3394354 RepID=UPI0039B52908
MYKHLYKRFIKANPSHHHFACHSHHYWPDITRDAQLQYWDDTAKFVDDKWEHIFSVKVPQAQHLIAEVLNLGYPEQIVFAPNTHEFVFRLLSSLDWNQKVRILTTDSEFYSFDRQINRLSELPHFEVVKIPTLPFDTFHERFEQAMESADWNLIFVSHVFFNSGMVCDVERLVKDAPSNCPFVIDGYHSFMAVPLNLNPIQDRVFYVAGSYKYAQGGEGCCFLYVPPSTRHRPLYTGWFAELSKLSAIGDEVGYPTDALQYAGSTMDFSAMYRLIATLEKFRDEGLTVTKIHTLIQQNQHQFLAELDRHHHPLVNRANLLAFDLKNHGHFLTFNLPSSEATSELVQKMKTRGLVTDSRGSRLRFGFGLYHDFADIKDAVVKI